MANQPVSLNAVMRELEIITDNIHDIRASIVKIEERMEEKYVSKVEFEPIKNIVYGLVGTILLAFIGAVISLVIIK